MAALASLAVACGGSDGEAAAPRSALFAYDASTPLQVREHGSRDVGVRDMSFASGADRIDGYLAVPRQSGRRPAVVYLHGAGADREQLLERAMTLAARGAVGLTISAPSGFATPPAGLGAADSLACQRDLAVRDVVAVRRAVDVLSTRPDVDPDRIGFVGWSAGARTGAILAAVEPRIDAFVLMSGGAVPVSTYANAAPPDLRKRVARVLGQVDPLRHLARGHGPALLIQDGNRDPVVPRHALVAFARAAPGGSDVRWYNSGHELDPVAYVEQLDWLANELSLDRKPRRWRPSWR